MKRFAAFLALGLLTGCTANLHSKAASDAVVPLDLSLGLIAGAPACRVGPDDGPVLADRGIGGTGASSAMPATDHVADRGIGGTGVIGVVTGFASICVDGLEVQYDASATVDIDGTSAAISALRAGQIVVIQAQGSPSGARALSISVRREVSGRIDSIDPKSGTLTIAGQSVSVPVGARGIAHVHPGDWVTVSGLRRPDGMIVASRLDLVPAGSFLVRGQVTRDGDVVRIGARVLAAATASSLVSGQFVVMAGRDVAGEQLPSSVTADPLMADPLTYFGPSVRHIIVQAFIRVVNGLLFFDGTEVPLSPDLRGQAEPDGLAIVSLARRADGSFMAVGVQSVDDHGFIASVARLASAARAQDGSAARAGHDTIGIRRSEVAAGGGTKVAGDAGMGVTNERPPRSSISLAAAGAPFGTSADPIASGNGDLWLEASVF